MIFGFGKVTKKLLGFLILIIVLMVFNNILLEKHAANSVITKNGGLGDSLIAYQEKYQLLEELGKDDHYIAYSFQSESSKLEVSFSSARENKAFQVYVYPNEAPKSAKSFISLLEHNMPEDSKFEKKVDNGDEYVYYYRSKKLGKAFDNEFTWGKKKGTFVIFVPKDLKKAQLVVSAE